VPLHHSTGGIRKAAVPIPRWRSSTPRRHDPAAAPTPPLLPRRAGPQHPAASGRHRRPVRGGPDSPTATSRGFTIRRRGAQWPPPSALPVGHAARAPVRVLGQRVCPNGGADRRIVAFITQAAPARHPPKRRLVPHLSPSATDVGHHRLALCPCGASSFDAKFPSFQPPRGWISYPLSLTLGPNRALSRDIFGAAG